jgi:hypothetical protein
MRRVQIHLDEELDQAASDEAARAAMAGWLQDGRVDDIDAVVDGWGDQTGRP